MPTKIIADTPELDIADLIEEINSGITDPKQKILTGLEAEKAVGIQHEFAADIILQSFYFGIGMSFRAGDPPAYDSIRAPKAGTVLTKSSNHGLAKSLIPVDEMFTRLDKYHRPIGFDEKDKSTRDLDQMSSLSIEDKKKFQPVVPLRHSLRDLLEMTNENGDLEVNSYDKTSGELVLVYKQDKGPKGFQGQFIINISDDKAVSVDKRHYARPWNKPKPDAIPSVINGSFSEQQKKDFFLTLQDKLDKEFYVHYKKNLTDIPQPFKVYSDLEGNPITGDWDLLLVGHPKEDLSIRARTVFNTFATKKTSEIAMKTIEQNALFSATKKLFKDLRGKVVKALELTGKEKQDVQKGLKTKDEIEKSKLAKMSVVENMLFKMPENELNKLYHDASMERAGRITPFEYLQAILLNRVYATPKSAYPDKTSEFDPNIKDLIQHGAENRNPYAPSDLDGKILHVYKGLVILTQNQDQLIHFYLKTDFLRENLIDIHHGWPMDKWAPVLEKQAKLNQINLFDLNDVVNNTFEKRRVVQSYQDYHQMLRMEKMGKALVLNESNAQIIMRIMLSYQKVPENLMQKLADFYLNNDAQYLKKVAIDIKMNGSMEYVNSFV